MEPANQNNLDQLEAAQTLLLKLINDGLHHGFFDYEVICEAMNRGTRQLIIKAGKSYKFMIPKKKTWK
jgi:hypothetical protein